MKKQNQQKKGHASPPAPKKKQSGSALSAIAENKYLFTALIGLVVLAVTVVRWRFINMPLERDEGEYAYFGHLILNGVAPYTEAYNMKLPGTYYMYALIMMIFGETFKGIHIGFVLMNAGTMILLYAALKRFFNPMTGVIAAGFYGLMGMCIGVLGFAAHATHFAVFYVALSLFFFSKYQENRKLLFAVLTGGMLGMAFLMKQQAVYFILFGGIVFLIFEFLEKPVNGGRLIKNTAVFSGGVFIPYLLVLLIMAVSGAFDRFWFWTVKYASKYVSGVSFDQGKELFKMQFTPIWNEFFWIWMMAIVGIGILLFTRFTVKQKVLAIAFSLFAFLATTPGFQFRGHYFVVFLPAGAIMAAITVDFIGRMLGNALKIGLVAIALPVVIYFFAFNRVTSNPQFAGYYKTENPLGLCKAIYTTNPFVESIDIAKYIKDNSNDTDKIAILGSEPQIPFYANRRSASGHIYTYGLMELHEYNLKMQEEMISEIEKEKPLFFIYCYVNFSWLVKPESPRRIMEWGQQYTQQNYDVVGLVDLPDQGPSQIYWNADAQNRQPKNQNFVLVFKRKGSTPSAKANP